MYLHEYQAKTVLAHYGIPILPFSLVSSPAELEACTADAAVLKIQVHAGGRGKVGGVLYARSPEEIRAYGKKLLGMKIVTPQTGPEGVVAEKIVVDTPVSFTKEQYFAVMLDRKSASVVCIASTDGGVEIEELAKHSPEKIVVERVPDTKELRNYQLFTLAKFFGWSDKVKVEGVAFIKACVQAFFATDALLLEINPFVLTKDEKLVALDAKMQIDDNALFRQPELAAMSDPHQMPLLEREARLHNLAYVALDGTIGCMVNGAGLAMATMDLIRFWGGEPANFLDVGGGATHEKVVAGFKILFKDPKVKAILVNIFGGIMNCEIIAKSLEQAVKEVNTSLPIVVRMEGTNVNFAKEMLKIANLKVFTADSLDEAAKCVVEMGHGNTR